MKPINKVILISVAVTLATVLILLNLVAFFLLLKCLDHFDKTIVISLIIISMATFCGGAITILRFYYGILAGETYHKSFWEDYLENFVMLLFVGAITAIFFNFFENALL